MPFDPLQFIDEAADRARGVSSGMPGMPGIPGVSTEPFDPLKFIDEAADRARSVAMPTPAREDEGLGDILGRSFGRGVLDLRRSFNLATGDIDELSELTRRLDAGEYRPSAEFERFQRAEGFGETWDAFVASPFKVTAEIAGQAAASSAVPIATAGAGALAAGPVGAAVGLGLGSAAVEATATYLGELAEQGVDLRDPGQVIAALQDEDITSRAKAKAAARGIAVGLIDAVTVGLSARLLAGAARATRTAGRVGRVGAAMGTEAAGGGIGEIAASVAAGDEVRVPDVAAEVIGEAVFGVGQAAPGAVSRLSGRSRTTPTGVETTETRGSRAPEAKTVWRVTPDGNVRPENVPVDAKLLPGQYATQLDAIAAASAPEMEVAGRPPVARTEDVVAVAEGRRIRAEEEPPEGTAGAAAEAIPPAAVPASREEVTQAPDVRVEVPSERAGVGEAAPESEVIPDAVQGQEGQEEGREAVGRPDGSRIRDRAVGSEGTAVTDRGRDVSFRYRLVEADDPIASNRDDLTVEPSFPAEFQPRDRTRQASADQVNQIEAGPRGELLGENPNARDGAPIMGPDGVIEGGNARTIGVRRAYGRKTAESYRAWLRENAERFGFRAEQVDALERPLLVRERTTTMDEATRVEFIRELNESGVARMGAGEQARTDAERMTGAVLDLLDPNENGEINTASNRDFVRAFMEHVASPSERGDLMQDDGTLSAAGVTRVRNAVVAKAYGDERLLSLMAEATDDNVRTVTSALVRAAPRFARVRALIDQGALPEMDPVSDIVAAAMQLRSLRERGEVVETYLQQEGLFGDELTPAARAMLGAFDTHKRSAKGIADILGTYARLLERQPNPQQGALIAVEAQPAEVLFERAVEEVGTGGQEALFADVPVEFMELPEAQRQAVAEKTYASRAQDRFLDVVQPAIDAGLPTERVSETGEPVGHQESVRAIERAMSAFGRPFRVQRGLVPQTVRGEYKPTESTARLPWMHDVRGAIHEGFHHVYHTLWADDATSEIRVIPDDVRAELERLGKQSAKRYVPEGGYAREGWAKFGEHLLYDGDAEQVAPAVSRYYREQVAGSHADAVSAVDEARETVRRYVEQGGPSRTMSQVEKRPAGAVGRVMRGMKEEFDQRGALGLADRVGEAFVEELLPLKRLEQLARKTAKGPLRVVDLPYQVAMALRGSHAAKADYGLRKGVMHADTTPMEGIDGLERVFRETKGRDRPFGAYLYAWTVVDRHNTALRKNRTVRGVSLQDAQATIAEFNEQHPDFIGLAERAWRWNRGWLTHAVELSPELAPLFEQFVRSNPHYTPNTNVLTADEALLLETLGKKNPFLPKVKGSDRKIENPLNALVIEMDRVVQLATKLKVRNTILDLHEKADVGPFVEQLSAAEIAELAKTVTDPRLRAALFGESGLESGGPAVSAEIPGEVAEQRSLGLERTTDRAETSPDMQTELFDEEEGLNLTALIPAAIPDTTWGGRPVMFRRKDGKIEAFTMDPRLYNALGAMDVHLFGKVADLLLAKPTRAFRTGTTSARPAFAVWQTVRDGLTLPFFTSTGPDFTDVMSGKATVGEFATHPLKLWGAWTEMAAKAVSGQLTNDPYYQLMERSGGFISQRVAGDIYTAGRTTRALGRTGARRWANLDSLRRVINFGEAVSRTAGVKVKAGELGWSPGMSLDESTLYEMMLEGRWNATDFLALGRIGKDLNQAIPFFNAAVQSARRSYDQIRHRPAKTALALAYITLPGLMLWWRNKDEDWWRDGSDYERYMTWQTTIGEHIYRVPLPMDIGNWSSIPVALLDAAYRDESTRDEVMKAVGVILEVADPFNGNILASTVISGAVIEQYANRDMFFDRPIVPPGEEDAPAGEQYNAYTSWVARQLGRMFPDTISPRRVDHLVESFFGPLSRDILQAMTTAIGIASGDEDVRAPEWSDIPALGRFVRLGGTAGTGSAVVGELYDTRGRWRRRVNSEERPPTKAQREYFDMLDAAAKEIEAIRREHGRRDLDREEMLTRQREIANGAMAVEAPEWGAIGERDDRQVALREWLQKVSDARLLKRAEMGREYREEHAEASHDEVDDWLDRQPEIRQFTAAASLIRHLAESGRIPDAMQIADSVGPEMVTADLIRRRVLGMFLVDRQRAKGIAIEAYGTWPDALRALWGNSDTFRRELVVAKRAGEAWPEEIRATIRTAAVRASLGELTLAEAIREVITAARAAGVEDSSRRRLVRDLRTAINRAKRTERRGTALVPTGADGG